MLAYVTCIIEGAPQLLVHRHRDFPEAGLQVPAGTIDAGEAPEAAVVRELWEESGLKEVHLRAMIGRYVYKAQWDGSFHDRHVFHIEYLGPKTEAWDHEVSAGQLDKGLVFRYEWLPLAGDIDLAGGQGDQLKALIARIGP